MIWAIGWYLTILVLGALVWPLAGRLFGRLPDRGYSVAKPLGWLVAGYGYWILVRFGVLPNARGTILLILFGIALGTVFFARPAVVDSIHWLRRQWRFVAVSEGVFLIAFALMLTLRAFNPEVAGTEKPMEFAFLNATLASSTFPPHDPWLSGHTISYYYFGYVLTAFLVRLTDVAPAIGFNLALALLFALAAQAIFGLVYGLVVVGRQAVDTGLQRGALLAGGAATLLLLVVGNLEGGLEFLHSRGLGSPEFWQAVGIEGLNRPYVSGSWYPTDNWFWWRATRVINTLVDGKGQDYTITEFPFFSFLLGDLHPHVLALPFALLAVTLAFDQFRYRNGGNGGNGGNSGNDAAGKYGGWGRSRRWISARAGAAALIVGSLGFLNSWDFPTYLALFVGAALIGHYLERPKLDRALIGAVARLAVPTAVLGVVLFLPFYVGFQSQASGLGLVGRYGAQLHHWLIFWGVLFLPVVSLLALSLIRLGRERAPRFWAIALAIGPVTVWLPAHIIMGPSNPPLVSWLAGKLILLLPMLGFAILAWWALDRRLTVDAQAGPGADEPGGGAGLTFVVMLAALASTLILGAELFFIRDVFNSRMNTVFKLYYQAWILLAVVAGFGLYYCAHALGRLSSAYRIPARIAWAGAVAVILAIALYYPAAGAMNRSAGQGRGPTLDGLAYARKVEPADLAAQEWLRRNAPGNAVVLEAVGGQ